MALDISPRSEKDADMAGIEKAFWLMFHPPRGQVPNYENPSSLAPLSLGLFPVLMFISVTAVGLRIWHNLRTTRRLKIDDCKICIWYRKRRQLISLLSDLIVAGVIFASAQVVLDLTGTSSNFFSTR